MAGKEVFQLEYASRAQHVLIGSHARNGGFMHAHRFGDIVQYERFHRFRTVFEERPLAIDDRTGNLEQRFIAAVKTFNEPARLL